MSVYRDIDGSDRDARVAGLHEERPAARPGHLGTGTLACPRCDIPVALTDGPVAPADPLACPYCGHAAAVRDFLSLAAPARPARVEVRLVLHTPSTRRALPS